MSKTLNSKISFPSLDDLGVQVWNKNFAKSTNIEVISTGSYALNRALGIGGWPKGKIIEIFGADSSGKSTLALHSVLEAQKVSQRVVYIDLENTLNPEWAKKIGVDASKLLVAYPNSGEEAIELIFKLIETKNVDLIVVDSVAALVPSLEFESNFQDQTMGLHARLMSKGLRIIQSKLIGTKTTIIFINQIREKIGNSYIPSITTTGGRALKYAASVRVEIKRCEAIKDSSNTTIGFATKGIVIKNKYGAPMSIANMALYFDRGFDVYHEVIQECLSKQVIVRKGSWFEYEGKNISQGLPHLRKLIKEDKELFEGIKKKIFLT
ncbi:Recombinase A [Mycoplasma haemocanis str. Illinois]|uniref:Protein RecA n=1 Tax=Mycoplasma haemocanis (strain Illinois) TaxID=1111676 RepID=H6N5X9_MYCHN|nr:recombinase RecA [Mycoplasma haemocanis]AEW44894.1 Recombinase A [Mycoplasma haemocanis str. Illinois]